MPDFLQAALDYAKQGFAVLPLVEKDKAPLTAHGLKDATTDEKQIRKWWGNHPNANIGIACGKVSGGIVAIDVDVDEQKGKHGNETLRAWEHQYGELPETVRSITGNGGCHIIYKDTETYKPSQQLYEDIDIRADGSYIVVPPSIHPNGNQYEWENAPTDIPIAQADSTVRKFLKGNQKNTKKVQDTPSSNTPIQEGSRVSALLSLIGKLVDLNLSNEAIKSAIEHENNTRCIPPTF